MKPTDELLEGQRALDSLHFVKQTSEWESTSSKPGYWLLRFRITTTFEDSTHIPKITHWCAVVSSEYPSGSIKIYPLKDGGLRATFQHQMCNHELCADTGLPYLPGDICLVTPSSRLGRLTGNQEPSDSYSRLKWHIQRAFDWICYAYADELAKPNDPFELPDFSTSKSARIATCEDKASFVTWKNILGTSGYVSTHVLKANPGIAVCSGFSSPDNKILHSVKWGKDLIAKSEELLGIWLLCKEVPHIKPWQAPMTWDELSYCCTEQQIDLFSLISRVANKLRDGKHHIFLIGFPIPETIGSSPKLIQWQGMWLPQLSTGRYFAKGFRKDEKGYFQNDKKEVLKGKINWIETENWSSPSITARGAYPSDLCSSNVLILGLGAVGGPAAEILTRGGCNHLTLVDSDMLHIGNLTRHNMSISDIGDYKVNRMAMRLATISPHINIDAIAEDYPVTTDGMNNLVQDADLIIDCTGSDDLLLHISRDTTLKACCFASLSLGYGGKRLFCYITRDTQKANDLLTLMQPWTELELEEHPPETYPREGVGCWNPIFPCRVDDVMALTAIGIKHIVSAFCEKKGYGLTVYEQNNLYADCSPYVIQSTTLVSSEVIWKSDCGRYKVSMGESVESKMLECCKQSKCNETGGILIGRYNNRHDTAIISLADEPTQDSEGLKGSFKRGIRGLTKLLSNCWNTTGEYYLGEWHFHPFNSPEPSDQDIYQMIRIANSRSYRCPEPLLLIVGGDPGGDWSLSVHVFDKAGRKARLSRIN